MQHADHQSIFGDTYHGVPSPLVPHTHPYPTRYHGPIFRTPVFALPYRERPYALAPYAGMGAIEEPVSKPTAVVVGAGLGAIFGAGIAALGGLVQQKPIDKTYESVVTSALGGAILLAVIALAAPVTYTRRTG